MWIAEGFILQPTQGEGDETIEDRGERYLEELVSRCMIQVSQRDHTGIGIKLCRMHDLVRDMCISKAKDENFLQVFEQHKYAVVAAARTFASIMTGQPRRIVVHPQVSEHNISKHLLEKGDLRLHSLLFFVEKNTYQMTKKQGISMCKNFRLLRVLNIENVQQVCHCLPKEIGNLIHLRYLGLRATGLARKDIPCIGYFPPILPASISNLKSLCALDLRDYGMMRLPNEMCKLDSLRHLLLGQSVVGLLRLDSLRNLETLAPIEAKFLIEKDAVMQMSNLRSLDIVFSTKEEFEMVLKSPSFELGRLRSLKMRKAGTRAPTYPNLGVLSRCQDLTKVVLMGRLYKQSLECLPASLTKLRLNQTFLEQDPMFILEKLHNLKFLSLELETYKGSEIVCSTNGFPRLEILRLESLEVEEWIIGEGAMPCLKTLYIVSLQKLKRIPEGLKFVTTLQELNFRSMGAYEKRVKTVNGFKGEDFEKVKHIPSISFHA